MIPAPEVVSRGPLGEGLGVDSIRQRLGPNKRLAPAVWGHFWKTFRCSQSRFRLESHRPLSFREQKAMLDLITIFSAAGLQQELRAAHGDKSLVIHEAT